MKSFCQEIVWWDNIESLLFCVLDATGPSTKLGNGMVALGARLRQGGCCAPI